MIISHKYKYIFIKTYKTAGTSLEVLLSQHLGERDVSTPFGVEHPGHIVQNDRGIWSPISELLSGDQQYRVKCIKDLIERRKFFNHIPARIARHRVPRSIWNSYFKFSVERNPWDKIVSLYFMKIAENNSKITLSEFIKRGSHCRNFPQYSDGNGQIIVDRVLKYESLTAELTELLGRLGVPFDGALSVRAKSNFRTERQSYDTLLTEKDRKLVAIAHADEIAAHGYSF